MRKLTKQDRSIIAFIGLLFAIALLLSAKYNLLPVALGPQNQTSKPPIEITAVPLGTINKPIQIIRAGSIENATLLPIKTESSGQLSEIYVTQGQAVKAGQPLLKIQLSTGSSVKQTAETSVTAAASPVAQIDYDNALKEFNHYQKLFEIGAIPRRQLDAAADRLQDAKDRLNNASEPATMPSANGTIYSAANASATINAPVDGIITALTTALGNTVQPGQQLLSIGSGQSVEVVVPLAQNDLYLIHLGTPVAIEVSQQTIKGQVSRIDPQIEANQVSSFLAHIKLADNPADLLKSGMSVNIHIDTGSTCLVPAVPTAAIIQDGQGRSFVYTAVNGKALRKQIIIGQAIGDFTEIASEFPQENLIITSNINDLKDGDPIAVIQ